MAKIRVAIDAMGGDYAPYEIVAGVLLAAKEQENVELLLVGDTEPVSRALKEQNGNSKPGMTIIPSEGKITEEQHPALSLKQKPNASISVAAHLVREGKADCLVTLGSTGAAVASAALILGLFEGVERPVLGGPFLGYAPSTIVMDLGSNLDCRPTQLLDFAIMGCVFAREYLKITDPRVGLLSVGSEEGKGNRQVKESYSVFRQSGLRFVGNVEGMDLFTDKADVIICDGFVGNILLKFGEGLGEVASRYLFKRLLPKLGHDEAEIIARELGDLSSLARKHGGPLFGVNGVVVVGHGSTTATGVSGAINMAVRLVELGLVSQFRDELAPLRTRLNA